MNLLRTTLVYCTLMYGCSGTSFEDRLAGVVDATVDYRKNKEVDRSNQFQGRNDYLATKASCYQTTIDHCLQRGGGQMECDALAIIDCE